MTDEYDYVDENVLRTPQITRKADEAEHFIIYSILISL